MILPGFHAEQSLVPARTSYYGRSDAWAGVSGVFAQRSSDLGAMGGSVGNFARASAFPRRVIGPVGDVLRQQRPGGFLGQAIATGTCNRPIHRSEERRVGKEGRSR